MILRRKGQRATIAVELDYQHNLCISGQPQAAIVSEISGLRRLHGNLFSIRSWIY